MSDLSDYVAVQIPGEIRVRLIKVNRFGSDPAMTYEEELILYFSGEVAKLREQRDRLAAALYDMAMRNNDGSANAILAEIGEGK